MNRIGFVVAALILGSGIAVADIEINTTLMHYTFRIEGPTAKPNEVTYGTGFLMGIPNPDSPGQGQMVLVTAAHVLGNISGETATIDLRQKDGERRFEKVPRKIPIRKATTPLWTQHPKADIAVLKVSLPQFVSDQSKDVPVLSTDLLANDEMLEKYEIHPGDELLCLGYPLGTEANSSGFAILRSGRIASYPLTPASEVPSFLFDFEVFEGNSGGPVYFVDKNRFYANTTHLGERIRFVVGVVTEEKYQVQRSVTPLEVQRDRVRYEVDEKRERLKLAVVVPAHFIRETLDLLKETKEKSQQPPERDK